MDINIIQAGFFWFDKYTQIAYIFPYDGKDADQIMIFVEAGLFSRLREDYLTDDEYVILQEELSVRPDTGVLIPGTAGLRKFRSPLPCKGKGKRGGIRIIYYWYAEKERIYLLTIYYKGEVADLTAREKKVLRQLVEEWKDEEA